MKKITGILRKLEAYIVSLWVLFIFLQNQIPEVLDLGLAILTIILILTFVKALPERKEISSVWSTLFSRIFTSASVLSVIGASLRSLALEGYNIFMIGILSLLISLLMIFFPKVQEVYLPVMKQILYRVSLLLLGSFVSFI